MMQTPVRLEHTSARCFNSLAVHVAANMGPQCAASRGQFWHRLQPRLCLKPSATLVPAAVGGRAQFGRKRTMSEGVEGDPKRSKAAPKTPPKAMPRTSPKAVPEPKTPPRAAPKTPPKAPPKQAPQPKRALPKPLPKAAERVVSAPGSPESGEALDAHLELLGVGTGLAQAPTCVWTSRKGGKIFLAGLPMAHTVHRFPKAALQVCCFPMARRAAGG